MWDEAYLTCGDPIRVGREEGARLAVRRLVVAGHRGGGDGLAAMAGECAVGRDGAEFAQAGSAPRREGGWPCAAMLGRERRTVARSAGAELSRPAGAAPAGAAVRLRRCSSARGGARERSGGGAREEEDGGAGSCGEERTEVREALWKPHHVKGRPETQREPENELCLGQHGDGRAATETRKRGTRPEQPDAVTKAQTSRHRDHRNEIAWPKKFEPTWPRREAMESRTNHI